MNKHYHLIGIGGIGMGTLATLLLKKGYQVSGSDLYDNQMVAELKWRGAHIAIGHCAANITGADYVVFSSAIGPDNVELRSARQQGIPALQRAELLAGLMEGHIGITVAGAHGKTTTTSMISNMLIQAGLQPTTAIGGIVQRDVLDALGYQASLGQGTYFVAEVDESDGSFLRFSPQYSVITNIDFEHVDYFHNWDNILASYRDFIRRTKANGLLIACGDDSRLSDLLCESPCPVHTYGFGLKNDTVAKDIRFNHCCVDFDCWIEGQPWGKVHLRIPGTHNIANAMASIALGTHLGIAPEVIRRSLANYAGAKRRFQIKSTAVDIWIVDDYAHHPTEIRSTLTAARHIGRKRLVTVFQPHRYTRVKYLWEEMAASFRDSDYIILTDIYAASELPIAGITSERLKEDIASQVSAPVVYLKKEMVVRHVLDMARPGDLIMMMGAGDITYLADEMARSLTTREIGSGAIKQ